MEESAKKLLTQISHIFQTDDLESELTLLLNQLNGKDERSKHARTLIQRFPQFFRLIATEYESMSRLIAISTQTLDASAKDILNSNKQLQKINTTMSTILENLENGILLFDQNGVCINDCSGVTKAFLGMDPKGKRIPEVLRIPGEEWSSFLDLYNYWLDPNLDFNELSELAPKILPHSIYNLELKYRLIQSDNSIDGRAEGIIVVITDKSAEIEADRRIKKSLTYSEMLMAFFNDRETFFRFIDLFQRTLDLLGEMSEGRLQFKRDEILRLLHTIKGCAGTLFIDELKELAHDLETEVAKFWDSNPNKFEERKKLVEIRSELEGGFKIFSMKNNNLLSLRNLSQNADQIVISKKSLVKFYSFLKNHTDKSISTLFKNDILTTQLVQVLIPLEQNAIASARRLGKSIRVEIKGDSNLKIYAEAYRSIFENLIHLVNNSLDHGIETQEERQNRGKDPTGLLVIDYSKIAENSTNFLVLKISDDGQGIDPQVIRKKLAEKNQSDLEQETDHQVLRHIFDMGFSTVNVLNDRSGRGIGMNAVLQSINELQGSIDIESSPGFGVTFTIKLPFIDDCIENTNGKICG